EFLAANVAGRGIDVSYADLERAPAVLLAGFEPDDESPIVFLRLRKAVRAGTLTVYSVAPLASHGLANLSGVLLPTIPGAEAEALGSLITGSDLDEAGRAAAAAPTRHRGTLPVGGRRARGAGGGGPGAGSGWRGRCPGRRAGASPGCHAGPVSAARSRRARCRPCCPA